MKRKLTKICLLIILIVFITGCGRASLSGEDFVDLIEKEDYITTNIISQFTTYPQIEEAYIAQNKDLTYQIEYYNLESEDDAVSFYNGNVKTFSEDKEKTVNETKLSKSTYEKYIKETSTKYYEIIRVNDTILYINADVKYKDDIVKTIENIGY